MLQVSRTPSSSLLLPQGRRARRKLRHRERLLSGCVGRLHQSRSSFRTQHRSHCGYGSLSNAVMSSSGCAAANAIIRLYCMYVPKPKPSTLTALQVLLPWRSNTLPSQSVHKPQPVKIHIPWDLWGPLHSRCYTRSLACLMASTSTQLLYGINISQVTNRH